MATITAAAGDGNWSSAATWVGGVVPTAADDVRLASTSGNVTIDAAVSCRSLDCTGYTGTLTHSAVTLTIGDATAGAGNIALKLVSGMTYTLANGATSAITFASTAAATQTIDLGGKTVGNIVIGVTGTPSYAFISAINQGIAATLTSTAGNVNFDGLSNNSGFTHTLGRFSATSTTARTLNGGLATYNFIGTTTVGSVVNITTSANLTMDFTQTQVNILCDTHGLDGIVSSWGNKPFNVIKIIGWSGLGAGSLNCNEFHRLPGLTPPTIEDQFCVGTGLNGRIKNKLVLYGYSESFRCVANGTNGVISTLDITGCVLDFKWASFVDYQFITGGTSLDFTSNTNGNTFVGGVGDLGGNTLVGGTLTFTPGVDTVWTATGSGDTNDPANWSVRVPLPQDRAVFNGTFVGNPTITVRSAYHLGAVDFSGSTGAVTLASGTTVSTIMRSFVGRPGVTVTSPLQGGVQTNFWWYDRTGNGQIIQGGATIQGTHMFSCATGGNFSFLSSGQNFGTAAISIRTGKITIPAGVSAGFTGITSTANNTGLPATVQVDGTVNLTGTGTVLSMATTANTFFVKGPGTIAIVNTSATQKNIYTTGNITIEPRLFMNGGTGLVNIGPSAGSVFTIYGLTAPNGANVAMGAGTTLRFFGSGIERLQNASNVVSIRSSNAGLPFTLDKTRGQIAWDYISLQDCSYTGTAPAHAGANSTNVSGNSGISFTAARDWSPQSLMAA